ncbi:MAG TPA: GntR family transcriptional regulator [Steroidobacteraceae bacterium]|nr:GntR family transcriptional regulator [Steroidobacteraceae bacterium]
MLIAIDERSTEPLFRQIASQIRRAIAGGKVQAGQRLPAARELAGSLDVNLHTVLRAFGELRDEGLVEMRRGRGVTVLGRRQQADLRQSARVLASEARRQGLSGAELLRLVKEYL